MTTRGVALAGTLALALAACGSGNQWGGSQGGSGGEGGNGGGGGNGGAPCPNGVTLRVVGTDLGNVTSLNFIVGRVTAAYEAGAPITVDFVGALPSVDADPHQLAVLHLTGLETKWGHALVDVAFSSGGARLGDLVGAFTMSCSAPLRVDVDPGLVKPDTCEAFLKLDVARSVAAGPAGLAFLPQFRVVYH